MTSPSAEFYRQRVAECDAKLVDTKLVNARARLIEARGVWESMATAAEARLAGAGRAAPER